MRKNYVTILAVLGILFAVSCGTSEQSDAGNEKDSTMQVEDVLDSKSEPIVEEAIPVDSVTHADTVSQE